MDMNELYSTSEKRLDTLLGEVSFWARMQRCRTSEEGEKNCTTDTAMRAWFLDTYGIKLLSGNTVHINSYSQEVEIVDEQKYTVFLLKYT
jgi:hypothetical protein